MHTFSTISCVTYHNDGHSVPKVAFTLGPNLVPNITSIFVPAIGKTSKSSDCNSFSDTLMVIEPEKLAGSRQPLTDNYSCLLTPSRFIMCFVEILVRSWM